ncbi:MAG: hypothetical protein HQ500_05990 [Flavobacteriales bacterium]|nr:hypothetical protein [Flavobacteriales bacterium]
MKRTLLLLLFSGVLFLPNCIRCHCPAVEDPYFDVSNIQVGHISTMSGFINLDEPISKNEYAGIALSLDVEYLAATRMINPFIQSAMACSCPDPGDLGAKHERFESIIVTTVNDFNQNIQAGDTITSMFSIRADLDTTSIDAFIDGQEENLRSQWYELYLNGIPENDSLGFEVEVQVTLSNGESYNNRTGAVFFQ